MVPGNGQAEYRTVHATKPVFQVSVSVSGQREWGILVRMWYLMNQFISSKME